ncbi:hypothetical protein FO519_006211 [Halicephalobus sp. NKZ332]|nr:hypothetical protein FO519_006211 [Halicephalobus sp. NKZ332]
MKSLKSPSEIFCEECRQRIQKIVDSVRIDDTKMKEELFIETMEFLKFHKVLVRDLKMVSAFALLLWNLVDFRVESDVEEIKKSAAESVAEFVEFILENADDENLRFSTPKSRLHIYFTVSSIYSILKPFLDVILVEQCYLEAKEITETFEPRSLPEKKEMEDLLENIESVHLRRLTHHIQNRHKVENNTDEKVEEKPRKVRVKSGKPRIKKNNTFQTEFSQKEEISEVAQKEEVSEFLQKEEVFESPQEEISEPTPTEVKQFINESNEIVEVNEIPKTESNPVFNENAKKEIPQFNKALIYPTIYRPVLLPPKITSTMNVPKQPLEPHQIPVIFKSNIFREKSTEEDQDFEITLRPLAKLDRPKFEPF